MAATDSVYVTLHGRGGHGSMPEAGVDPTVMAASIVMRLQTIISREIASREQAVLTVGMLQSGSTANVIPDTARLGINVRSYSSEVRDHICKAIERIIRAEAELDVIVGVVHANDIGVVELGR